MRDESRGSLLSLSLHRYCGIAVLVLLLVGPWGAAIGASLTDMVRRDLAPAKGVVVTVEGDEIIVDLDATDGLKAGDLVTVLGHGKPLTHPVTGKTIGTLESTKALLSVSRIRDGFSHARPIKAPATTVRRGDQVRRFGAIPARFWDYSGDGEPLFGELRDALPALEWGDYASDQARRPKSPAAAKDGNALLFVLRDDQLEVRDPNFQNLYTYPLTAGNLASARPAPTPVAVNPPTATPVWSQPTGPATGQTPVFSPEYGGMQRHGVLPGGATTMAAFLPHQGQLLLAAASGNTLRVLAVDGGLRQLAEMDVTIGKRIHAVQWWLPEGADRPYLAVTAFGNEEMGSAVLAFEGTALRRVQGFIPAILGTLDLDNDGRPETLLRQSFDRDIFWGMRVRELTLAGDELREGPAPLDLPRGFAAVGSTSADLTGDGRPEMAVIRGRTLKLYDNGKDVHTSPGMGGSLSQLLYAVNPGQQDQLMLDETFEIDPIIADLDNDGRPDLLAPASAQGMLSVSNIASGFKSTQLAVLSYRNGQYLKGRLGEELDLPIQGLGLHAGRVYLVTTQPGDLLGKGGESRLMSFQLAQ